VENSAPQAAHDINRQLRQYVESLRLAGVEWLPIVVGPGNYSQSAQVMPAETTPGLHAGGGAGEAPAPDLEERRRSLAVLAETVSRCTRCPELVATRRQTVFGVGSTGAELCFIGEAPGADEDAQGEPFVGAAGQLLNKIIAACNLKRQDVYICNIIKCRPPGNRTPLPHEVANCRGYFEEQLARLQPKFICALGSTAAQNLLGTTLSIGKLRGRFHDYKGIPVLCTYHPAFLLPHRSPQKKKDVWEDMKLLLRRMGRTI
jgi:DNA polymerase